MNNLSQETKNYLENQETLDQDPKLIAEFKAFKAERQQKYQDFWNLDDNQRSKLLEIMHNELNQAYIKKMLGPKLRHCSAKTKNFCIQWFESEKNPSFKEEALAMYEQRIAIEENLTYVFESFSIKLKNKYFKFYQSLYDEKEQILDLMFKEKDEAEKEANKQQPKSDKTQTVEEKKAVKNEQDAVLKSNKKKETKQKNEDQFDQEYWAEKYYQDSINSQRHQQALKAIRYAKKVEELSKIQAKMKVVESTNEEEEEEVPTETKISLENSFQSNQVETLKNSQGKKLQNTEIIDENGYSITEKLIKEKIALKSKKNKQSIFELAINKLKNSKNKKHYSKDFKKIIESKVQNSSDI
ncbi:hypothetical protein GF376_03020 [Candidatus Peregrinibacteria bacterium]|nr:hypothetical protein [Candidatus Peregrinibacteria bacterium]